MKISIWYNYTNDPYGGSNNFLRRLGHSFRVRGIEPIFGFDAKADVLLLNAFVCGPNQYLNVGQVSQAWSRGRVNFIGRLPGAVHLFRRLPRSGMPIIHRVDGVTGLYGRKSFSADHLTREINQFADTTIFQSKFCLTSFQEFGMRPCRSVVINNGVPLNIFYPEERSMNLGSKIRLVAVSWSKNPMKGFATLAELSTLPNVTLTFIGNWADGIDRKAVSVLGARTEREIAEILRQHDAFVHAAINEPSSNAIVEALASGLPVLYRDSGGNAELVKDCGMAFTDNLEMSITSFIDGLRDYRRRTFEQRQRFSIDFTAEQYLQSITQTVESFKNYRIEDR